MSSKRSHLIWHIVLANPLVFITTIVIMLSTAMWFPKGVANVDNIVLPLMLFLLIWTALFFYASLSARLCLISSTIENLKSEQALKPLKTLLGFILVAGWGLGLKLAVQR